MKKLTLILATILLLLPLMTQAEQALSKQLITSFGQVSKQWENLEDDYPEISPSLEDIDFNHPEKMINVLKNSKAYPKLKASLANSEFDSIEEFYNVGMRVMGGMMAHQMQKMPQAMDTDAMSKMLVGTIKQMKENNISGEMIEQMEAQLADMDKNMKMMQAAMSNTSSADKKFISDNAQWVMSILDD